MKQKEIAEKFKLDAASLNRIINGKQDPRNMTVAKAIRFADALQWTLEKLMKSKPEQIKRRFFSLYENGNKGEETRS